MDPVITDLLDRYETGRLSRRDLVTGLSALAAVSAAPALAQPAPPQQRTLQRTLKHKAARPPSLSRRTR